MPAVKIVTQPSQADRAKDFSLPTLLQTPAGLAIIEVQGTIHAPSSEAQHESDGTQVGRLQFPLYEGDETDAKEGPWMKKAHLYIGKHQRLNGEVRKLAKPLAVLMKDDNAKFSSLYDTNGHSNDETRLQILAVVRYKILFSSRPEPVGD